MTSFENLKQGFNWIESFTNFERKPVDTREYRLDRMYQLLELFDNPHTKIPSIHIAGSKGKGSIATLTATALQAGGLGPVGLFRSPHIRDYRERITLAGNFFPDELYISVLNDVYTRVCQAQKDSLLPGEPTTFELLTLVGFVLFFQAGCKIIVLEVGLGGRLDATNVVIPLVSILTSLELEHTDILGPTIVHIAREKAGIIKESVPVFSFPQEQEAMQIIQDTANKLNAPISLPFGTNPLEYYYNFLNLTWQGCTYTSPELTMHSLVPGRVHCLNCVFTYTFLKKMVDTNLLPPGFQLQKAFQAMDNLKIPGRMEVRTLPSGVTVILDGAHTKNSAAILSRNIRDLLQNSGKIILVLGISGGKNYAGIAQELMPLCKMVFVTTPGTFKVSDPAELAKICNETKTGPIPVILEPETTKAFDLALEQAKQFSCPFIITGSFYLLGEAEKWMEGLNK